MPKFHVTYADGREVDVYAPDADLAKTHALTVEGERIARDKILGRQGTKPISMPTSAAQVK